MSRSAAPLTILLMHFAGAAFAHGDTAPQAVDTTGLPDLPEEMATVNPWRGAEGDVLFRAVEIGSKGFNSNCARCHGLEAISGGLAPDLRYLEASDFGDEWYLDRVLNGYEQNGAVKMPPFDGILSQEAIWAIRTYIETRADPDEMAGKAGDIAALRDRVAEAPPEQVEAVAAELDTLGDGFAALSGGPRSVTVLQQSAHLLRAHPDRTTAAAELISSALED
jgi:cytochrome c-550 PedF